MRGPSPNNELLRLAAQALGPLCDELVFVGGCAVDLLITDPAGPRARATRDVDVIAATTSRSQYQLLTERLRSRGFVEDDGSEVICRWRHREHHLQLDLMPTDPAILGFSNPWYDFATATASEFPIDQHRSIRLIGAPAFIATKLVAFQNRGRGDWLSSHDLEDILVVVDGRPELTDEVQASAPEVRDWIREQIGALLNEPRFVESLPGLIENATRTVLILGRLQNLGTSTRPRLSE